MQPNELLKQKACTSATDLLILEVGVQYKSFSSTAQKFDIFF